MLQRSSLATWGAALLLLSSLSSCEDILEQYFPKPTPPPVNPTFPPLGQDIAFYALSGARGSMATPRRMPPRAPARWP
ncbi:hypothetical protein H9L05_21635 (plasmid) [Hymenobacter qilianensis]|uniref:RagB/SusD family nutrient uptake outer membrane protein n=1 Tax=Hymenobacter qilianensis TaxID=1385715 RepID=A0A7H0H160_9BACT|nr:hypothetical protein [Hymenobacter qilianensis]QNP54276.1 hypothetical protein H9L05_21635 [Hymenobacter qilianensis]